ncbi:MAG: hypothetical protein BWY06_02237 [Candidatus Latescibacteria bacterium ADurb.Bin168]|nr:MAG: hypothetical protein BWY06_02237 [Candidatus Latescibacteria bacterium ADurb.Bin168]
MLQRKERLPRFARVEILHEGPVAEPCARAAREQIERAVPVRQGLVAVARQSRNRGAVVIDRQPALASLIAIKRQARTEHARTDRQQIAPLPVMPRHRRGMDRQPVYQRMKMAGGNPQCPVGRRI